MAEVIVNMVQKSVPQSMQNPELSRHTIKVDL